MRCNRCTLEFDHHCKYLNNCIGKKNYKLFFRLILSLELFEAFMLIISFINIFSKDFNFKPQDISIYLNILRSMITFVANGYLVIFHIYIQRNNLTTLEYIIKRKKSKNKAVHNLTDISYRNNETITIQEQEKHLNI